MLRCRWRWRLADLGGYLREEVEKLCKNCCLCAHVSYEDVVVTVGTKVSKRVDEDSIRRNLT